MEHATIPATLTLPLLVTSPADVSRLKREVAALSDYLHQQALRTPGTTQAQLPKVSRMLDELAAANGLNLLDAAARDRLAAFLQDTTAQAPVIHMSFAVDPSSAFLQKIVQWFRQTIHPAVLIRVGLQPSIAAGCTVQTTNQYFDLSLRRYLQDHRQLLVDSLVAAAADAPAAAVAPMATVPAEAMHE